MTAFLIGAAELAALEAGQPAIVADPGMAGLEALPLAVLRPRQAVLRRLGAAEGAAMPLPAGLAPLAIVAPDREAAQRLAAGLPDGVPHLIGADPVPGLLARLVEVLAGCEARLRRHGTLPEASGAGVPIPPARPAPSLAAEMAPTGADFQGIRLHQFTANADRSYQHIDLGLTGLAAASGLWREVRLKLFDRRGTIGLEFRGIKGWPAMFDVWPNGGSDQFGPFWRLETRQTLEAVASLASPHNRALLAALLEVLPGAARDAAGLADLTAGEQDEWARRALVLVAAVSTAVATADHAGLVSPG